MYYSLPDIEEWLRPFPNFERRPDKNMLNLQTMHTLCEYFDHPELERPCFHVAGSKGKGTISNGIAAILRDEGYTTGVFASPHISYFTERISSGEAAFPIETYQKAFEELRAGIDELTSSDPSLKDRLTWYELVTVLAMLSFKEAKVDYAIYEVGMGGRLDATNIIIPQAIAMGPIELEHTEYLGDTLAKIATEKAGVFKPNVPIFSAPQAPEVQAVFHMKAFEQHAALSYVANSNDYRSIDAEVAARAVRAVVPSANLERAREIAMGVKLPGRYERIPDCHGLPYLLLDGAHTASSTSAILERMKRDGVHGNLIFACAADKNVEQIAALVAKSGLFEKIYLTRPGDFKKSDLPRAKKAFEFAFSHTDTVIESSPDFIATIKKAISESAKSKSPLIAFGSFYLLAEIKKVL